ncbi:hypothetical protein [Rhizobium leguminosarum]|uniref:hypothetical protein n=1 Tax=Rhizobium leguminosarum TaxID=384 RepID=UPI0013EE94EE|nr:hypothetical protein [Rhizobium leguminosarum]
MKANEYIRPKPDISIECRPRLGQWRVEGESSHAVIWATKGCGSTGRQCVYRDLEQIIRLVDEAGKHLSEGRPAGAWPKVEVILDEGRADGNCNQDGGDVFAADLGGQSLYCRQVSCLP